MSYDPQIIINWEDFIKHEDTFALHWEFHFKTEEENAEVLKYLHEIRKQYNETEPSSTPFEIQGIKMISCHPELTGFNKRVRKKLDELGIEYAINI